jgi:hypothetical protein
MMVGKALMAAVARAEFLINFLLSEFILSVKLILVIENRKYTGYESELEMLSGNFSRFSDFYHL